MTTKKQRERDEARAELLKLLKPGDTIYSIVRSVSRSGMRLGDLVVHGSLSPHEWARALRDVADRLCEGEVEGACTEEAFIDDAEANGREFYSDGRDA